MVNDILCFMHMETEIIAIHLSTKSMAAWLKQDTTLRTSNTRLHTTVPQSTDEDPNICQLTDKPCASDNFSVQHVECRRIDYCSIFIGTKRQPHRQNKNRHQTLLQISSCDTCQVKFFSRTKPAASARVNIAIPDRLYSFMSFFRHNAAKFRYLARPHRCSN